MKRILILATLTLSTLFCFSQLPDLNGYWEATYYSGSSGSTGDFDCGVYQTGNTVHAIAYDNFIFEGNIDSDTLSGDIDMNDDGIIHVRVFNSNDSVVFTYHNDNYSVYGNGFLEKISDCATLIVDYSYTGDLVEVSREFPVDIEIYDSENILESNPIFRLRYEDAAGTAYIAGILTSPIYCVISTGYNDSVLTFYDLDLPYSAHGPDPANLVVSPINIAMNNSETISLTFDDTYLYHMEAEYPGGKLEHLGSYELPYTPRYIAAYNNQFYIVNSNQQVLVYSEAFDLLDTLKDNNGQDIFAHAIQFKDNGEFYACDNVNINRYSSSNELLGSYNGISTLSDIDIELNEDAVYYSYRDEIIKLDNTLSTVLATLTKADIQSDYPPFASQDFYIRDIAFDNNNRLAIAIDAEPDYEGKDLVIYYDETLSNVVDTIAGIYWEMNNPICIDFDNNNYCYIASYWNDILKVYNADKECFSASYWEDAPGTTNGAMDGPVAHVIKNNKAYVIENENNRVSVFQIDPSAGINTAGNVAKSNSKVYPVPFSSETNISFSLANSQTVSIAIYDINGRLVEQLLLNRKLAKGKHKLKWRSNTLKGMYFVSIQTETYTESHQLIIL